MTLSSQSDRAARLRELHRPGDPLVLANVWDAATARLVAAAGAPAVATASASVSWTLGVPDGDRLGRDLALAQAALVVANVPGLPVTVDLESGYADTPAGVGDTVTALLATGAVGLNLEDAAGPGVRPLADAADRVAAARAAADTAGIPLFLNARTDVFLRAVGPAEGRLDEALTRAKAFLAAGADGVFVPGVADPEVIAVLAREIPAPLNVLAGPGSPTVAALAALGVARISLGPALAKSAYAAVRDAATEIYTTGTYDTLAGGLDYAELNALFG
ncbi:isocitrate lyase/phosphoenolpyruvate mutase family protein [Kitasatospora sp. NPDC048365]|uniref:isocitrate lyase/PEP mutase family protein n=1 Tax=Kitasatospora sp. NPDC048365 TaxID=3364050 RepID=UPI0037116124